jgi:hypothetical protein
MFDGPEGLVSWQLIVTPPQASRGNFRQTVVPWSEEVLLRFGDRSVPTLLYRAGTERSEV